MAALVVENLHQWVNTPLAYIFNVMGNHTSRANDRFSGFSGGRFPFRADNFSRRTFPSLTVWCLGEKNKTLVDSFSGFDSFVFHFGGEFH